MHEVIHTGSAQDGPQERRALLERIVAGKTFHRSARLRDVLLDIGEQTLAGRVEELSEQAIGVRVFGREQGYNAADDNIVRASVRQVRLKLREYFETEGAGERLILEIPKGSYVAVFAPRAGEAPAAVEVGTWWRSRWVMAGVGVAVMAGLAWLLGTIVAGWPGSGPQTIFTSLLAQNADPVRFVLTDSSLVILNQMTGEVATLEDYASRRYLENGRAGLDAEMTRMQEFVATRQITSLADVTILSRLYQENPTAARRIEIRYARHMQLRDFKTGNFIVTGSSRSNPWTAAFDSSFNFRFDFSAKVIRNLSPIGQEPRQFQAKPGLDYARVALVRNLSGNGFVLLIAGVNAEGTEGAGEFLLRKDSLQQMEKALGSGSREALPPCEFILEIRTIEGTSSSAEIVAARRH